MWIKYQIEQVAVKETHVLKREEDHKRKKLFAASLQTHEFIVLSQVLESDPLYNLKTREAVVRK
jgi:hypothetical protein